MQLAEFDRWMVNADYHDIKTYTGTGTLNEFIAGFLNYSPGWLRGLYAIRWGFVRLLGMRQKGIPNAIRMLPEDVPMQPGKWAGFFKVEAAAPDHFWIASATDKHLTAYLGIAAHSLADGLRQFHVVTIVKYHHWTGPVYFNVIRPFHHIVVDRMARAGVKA